MIFYDRAWWYSTVGINPRLSDLKGPGTSSGGTSNKIELIGMNSRFALIQKKAQEQKLLKNLTILKNLKEKKVKFQPCIKPTQRPPDD